MSVMARKVRDNLKRFLTFSLPYSCQAHYKIISVQLLKGFDLDLDLTL